jgi:CheY-like chemotaxis protein
LICEDNSLNQQVICDHLARVGLNTVVAGNGKEALDIVAGRTEQNEPPFDLIFMDIYMPVMDGLEAASKITALGVKSPIVALTANAMTSELALYKASGMFDFVRKPFTSQELWGCLVKYIPVESYSEIDRERQSVEDEKLQKQLKLNFAQDNQTVYDDITDAVNAGDMKSAHRLAHTLKSTAGNIGEKQLQSAAGAVEDMLKNGEYRAGEKREKALKQMRDFESELKKVLGKLAPLLAESNAKNIEKTGDADKIRGIIENLEPMLINNNPDCEDLLDDIRTIPGSEELVRQIERFKFNQALEELSKIKKEWGSER